MITAKGVAVPEDMANVLRSDEASLTAFEALRPDDQRVYVEWIKAAGGSSERSERLSGLGEHVRAYHRRPAQDDSPHPLSYS